jgi:hypothetical protein
MVLLKAQRLQQLAEKLGQIENRLARGGGELEEAGEEMEAELEEELEEAAALTGVELEAVRWLDGPTLLRTLSPGGRPDPGRFWTAAEVLYLDALRAEAEGDPATADRRFRKARLLYERAGESGSLELPDGAVPPEERLEVLRERRT